jgi:hypothetical protein
MADELKTARVYLELLKRKPLRVIVPLLALALAYIGKEFLSGYAHKSGELWASRRQVDLSPSLTSPLSYRVAVLNHTTLLPEDEIQAGVKALQIQVHRDLAPIWGVDADLTYIPSRAAPPVNSWWLELLDNTDQTAALGYHDVTPAGLPLGKVFLKEIQDASGRWTLIASHELMSMLVNPRVNLGVFVVQGRKDLFYAYEISDPCQSEEAGYTIDNVLVSDFVFPAWFEPTRVPESTQFDFTHHIRRPLEILSGGYVMVYEPKGEGEWRYSEAK